MQGEGGPPTSVPVRACTGRGPRTSVPVRVCARGEGPRPPFQSGCAPGGGPPRGPDLYPSRGVQGVGWWRGGRGPPDLHPREGGSHLFRLRLGTLLVVTLCEKEIRTSKAPTGNNLSRECTVGDLLEAGGIVWGGPRCVRLGGVCCASKAGRKEEEGGGGITVGCSGTAVGGGMPTWQCSEMGTFLKAIIEEHLVCRP